MTDNQTIEFIAQMNPHALEGITVQILRGYQSGKTFKLTNVKYLDRKITPRSYKCHCIEITIPPTDNRHIRHTINLHGCSKTKEDHVTSKIKILGFLDER